MEADFENQDLIHKVCMDCGVDDNESYMLTDALWRQINPFIVGLLCLPCVEDRLGRSLCRSDFTMLRDAASARKSPGLAQRFDRSHPEPFKEGMAARLAKKTATQSALGRISAQYLLEGRGAELGDIPEFVSLLSRSGMFPADPVQAILTMAAKGHQRLAAETMARLKARSRKMGD